MFYLNGEKVSVDKLISEYNIPMPNKTLGIFELDKSQIRRDRSNGGIKYAISKQVRTKFRGTDPKTKEDVEVAYSEGTPKRKDGIITCFPRNLEFTGHRTYFDTQEEKEKWVFFYLYPRNKQSPFRPSRKVPYWQIFDPELQAGESNRYDDLLTDCLLFIRECKEADLKHKAKGMGIDVTQFSHAEIMAAMRQKAKANPERFLNDLTDHSVEWKGRVLDAIDSGVFTQVMKNGLTRWHWGKGDFTGEEICIVQASEAPLEALMRAMADGDFSVFHGQLKIIEKQTSVKEKTDSHLKDIEKKEEVSVTDMINALIENQSIIEDGGEAFWNTQKGRGDKIGKFGSLESIFEDEKLYKRLKMRFNLTK